MVGGLNGYILGVISIQCFISRSSFISCFENN